MKRALFALLTLVAAPAGAQSGAPEHSKVEVTTKSQGGGSLQFSFKVLPNEGMAVTLDAPWKLTLESPGLTFAKTSLAKEEMDEKLPGFVVTTTGKPATAAGEVGYSLVAFICTKDKTRCYREVHKGKQAWKLP